MTLQTERIRTLVRFSYHRLGKVAKGLVRACLEKATGLSRAQVARAVMRRQLEVSGDWRFERLAGLSNGHLYNLRKCRTCRNVRASIVLETGKVLNFAKMH